MTGGFFTEKHRSFKNHNSSEDGNDDVQAKKKETHASVKLLAWENKSEGR